MTIAISLDKTGINQTTDDVSSANIMLFANDVDNTFNDVLNGVQAFDKQLFTAATTMTIDADGAIGVPTQAFINVSAWSGTSDFLDTIGVSNNTFLVIKPTSGHTIVVVGDGSGNITSSDGGSFFLTGDQTALLYCQNSQWSLIGSSYSTAGLANFGASTDPTPGDDTGDGYSVGSHWVNTTADRAFINVDATASAAIWKRITPPKNKWGIRAANASALSMGIASVTVANSPANANDSTDTFMTLPSTAAAGNLAGWITASFNLIRSSFDPTIEIWVKTSSDLTSQRLWIGLVDADITNVDTLAAGREFIGFRYSTNTVDAGWMPVLHDGTTQNVGTALVAIATSTVYKLKIRIVSGGTPTAYFSVNDGAEQSMQTNFPAIATDLGAVCRVIPIAASIRSLSFSSFSVQWG